MIETRTIAVKRRGGDHKPATPAMKARQAMRQQRSRERSEQREHHVFRYSGGVTRCSRCPPRRSRGEPDRFCPDCAQINRARQIAGLIRPTGDPRPSTDNIINPTVVGKYRGPAIAPRYNTSAQPVVTAFVEQLGKGWRRGVATLNGKRVYVGKPVRTAQAAWDYAAHSQKLIKLGLSFESDCADVDR